MYYNEYSFARIEFFDKDGNSILSAGSTTVDEKKEEVVLADDECIMGIIA